MFCYGLSGYHCCRQLTPVPSECLTQHLQDSMFNKTACSMQVALHQVPVPGGYRSMYYLRVHLVHKRVLQGHGKNPQMFFNMSLPVLTWRFTGAGKHRVPNPGPANQRVQCEAAMPIWWHCTSLTVAHTSSGLFAF